MDHELKSLETVVAESDLLILCTPNALYRSADLKDKPVVDIGGHLSRANVIRAPFLWILMLSS
jgi:UDP-N-acetyl-D-mannosaminuronic acid dehydrogenase